MDDDPPLGAFENWLAEWRRTRVKAGEWIDREDTSNAKRARNGRRQRDERSMRNEMDLFAGAGVVALAVGVSGVLPGTVHRPDSQPLGDH